MAGEFKIGLGTPHVSPEVRVEWEHLIMFAGLGALDCKLERELSPSVHQLFLVEIV